MGLYCRFSVASKVLLVVFTIGVLVGFAGRGAMDPPADLPQSTLASFRTG